MTRALTRTNFNSSRLIRLLADQALVDAFEPGYAFAEKLGLWLDVNNAITLFSAHNVGAASLSEAKTGGPSIAGVAVSEEFTRKRATLVDTITKSCSPNETHTRIKLPAPELGVPMEIAASYEPYRRFYLAHQRDMDLNIRPLRANVREVLSRTSSPLKKLAAMDAAFDEILVNRESKLLSTVPLLLEKRFEQLLKAHQQILIDTQQADNPALWMQAGGWLSGFCIELQTVLLAELDIRLQPVMGLIEAFNNEIENHK